MKVEKLSKGKSKKILIAITILVLVIGIIYITNSKAKYQVTKSVQIVNGNVNYKKPDLKILAFYKEKESYSNDSDKYELTQDIPIGNYIINEEKSSCKVNNEKVNNVIIRYENNSLTISNITKNGTMCYVYFDMNTTFSISELIASKQTQASKTSFTEIDTTDNSDILYVTKDDFGDSYYFRGKINSNWLKFGTMGTDGKGLPIWWRIIRINGDKTIRLIYSGIGETAPTDDGYTVNNNSMSINEGTTYCYAACNLDYTGNTYVGFQYTMDQTHGHATDTNVLIQLTNWFKSNLIDEWSNENGNIDYNQGFCNDRSSSTKSTTEWTENMTDTGGTKEIYTYYGASLRLNPNEKNVTNEYPSKPTLKCGTKTNRNNDYFTYTGASRGTRSLTYPIGLITADEVTYAGGLLHRDNKEYYLYMGKGYWTISPNNGSQNPNIFYVYSSGDLNYTYGIINGLSGSSYGLRPVINLKSNIKLSGEGTYSNPFVVQS